MFNVKRAVFVIEKDDAKLSLMTASIRPNRFVCS
jgi:hypothetical protein